jgi:hypothetical protein
MPTYLPVTKSREEEEDENSKGNEDLESVSEEYPNEGSKVYLPRKHPGSKGDFRELIKTA